MTTVWLAVVLPTLAYAICAVPEYTSEGAVQVSSSAGMAGAGPLLELMGGGPQAEVQTEVEIMRRPEFVLDVLHGLRLELVDPDEPRVVTADMGVAFGGASPVAPALRALREAATEVRLAPDVFEPVPATLEVLDDGTLRLSVEKDGTVVTAEGHAGTLLEAGPVGLVLSKNPIEPGTAFSFEVLPDGELLERYERRIHVTPLGTQRDPTNIVRISVRHRDRATAQAIAQRMMEHYLDKTLEWQSKSASQAAEFIEEQLASVEERLTSSEDALRSYAASENAVQLDTQAKVAIEQASELEARRIALGMQLSTIGAVLRRLSRAEGGDGSASADLTANFFEDPVLAEAVGALTQAETHYATLRASLTPEHPRVRQLGRALAEQRKEVRRLLASARKNLRHQVERIDAELEKMDAMMRAYPDKQLELARLVRQQEVNQRLYTMLLEKHEEARIVKASTTTDKRIVDTANLPHKRTSPQRARLLAFSGFAGLFLGLVAAAGRELLQRTVDTVEAARDLVPFPVYGTIPEVEGFGKDGDRRLGVRDLWARPHDAAPEAFRALGVAVALLPVTKKEARIVVATSAQPGEGKSTVTANLAASLARAGKKVLLVDLDLRKPVQHRMWKETRAPGYSDLLGSGEGAAGLSTFGRRIDEPALTLLPAGTRLPDTVSAVMNADLDDLLAAWSRRFDFIVVDSPPAFVAETRVLAQHADLLLLVTRPGRVERAHLRHAVESLERHDCAKGLVLNAVARRHAGDDYGYGYYYYHSAYGTDATEAAAKEDVA